MSNSTSISQDPTQRRELVLGPGIVGLFLQGFESGLVIAQFCRWFSLERNDSVAFSTLVVSVTMVGLAQSGISIASTWKRYVQGFGKPISVDWSDYLPGLPTLLIAVPIQALMIRRCYHIVGKNIYIITPLVLLLITSIATSIWSIVATFRFELTAASEPYLRLPAAVGISCPYLMNLLVPSILDVVLTGILLHCLTQTMRQVYAKHIRRRLSHLMIIVWQSAIPPTFCTIFLCILYIQHAIARQEKLEFWYITIQEMVGKFYVLSLFYIINGSDTTEEQLSTFIPTLTVPNETFDRFSLDARASGAVSCHRREVAHVSAMSLNNAV